MQLPILMEVHIVRFRVYFYRFHIKKTASILVSQNSADTEFSFHDG